MSTHSWQVWIDAVRQGDAVALADFWSRYASPLLRLAERNIQQNLRRRVDPEDVVQSAFRTVLRRMQGGEFLVDDDEQLWKLLCAVTLNKSRRQARRHLQQKRAVDREMYIDQAEAQMAGVESDLPSPTDAAILVDLIEHIVHSTVDEEERSVLLLKLEDYSNQEIADQMERSERTVRRIMGRIKSRCVQMLEAEE